jgi:hypothetical protein
MNASTSAPARQRKPRTKPARSIRLCVRPEGETPGVVRITVGRKAADYFLTLLPADFGRGFKVEKIGTDTDEAAYHVNVSAEGRTCECQGYLRHHHCKHGDGLAALIAAGRL